MLPHGLLQGLFLFTQSSQPSELFQIDGKLCCRVGLVFRMLRSPRLGHLLLPEGVIAVASF